MSGKKILVTGGAGFIGSHIVDRLIDLGHEVTVVDAVGLGLEKKTPVGKKLILEGIQFPDIVNLIPEDTDLIGFSGMFSSDWVIIKPLVNMIGEKFKDKRFHYFGK